MRKEEKSDSTNNSTKDKDEKHSYPNDNDDMDNSDNEFIEEIDNEEEEDNNNDDDIEYGLKQALPVAEEDAISKETCRFETSGGYPSTAEEYLLWVRQEAKRYPKISVSPNPMTMTTGGTTRMPSYHQQQQQSRSSGSTMMTKSFIGSSKRSTTTTTTRSIKISEALLPCQTWIDIVIRDFERVRDYLEFLRSIGEQQEQMHLEEQRDLRKPMVQQFPSKLTDEKSWYNWCFNDRQGPRFSQVVMLDQEQVWLLMEDHLKWLQSKRFNETQVGDDDSFVWVRYVRKRRKSLTIIDDDDDGNVLWGYEENE
jgi:hypothetical protein